MTSQENQEPPRHIWYSLDEALFLLEALEDARDALTVAGYLVEVVEVEHQIQLLSRRLDFTDPGEADG